MEKARRKFEESTAQDSLQRHSHPRLSPRMRPARIYLTGFMGSGKSTVGPLLAQRWAYHFVDLDDVIEETIQMPIRKYFREHGEQAFRAREREALRAASQLEASVIAVGGGALTFTDNLTLARKTGCVIYLQASVDELVQRLEDQASERPLLQDKTGKVLSRAEMAKKIARMLEARAPFYEQAHLTLRVDGFAVGAVVDAIDRLVPSAAAETNGGDRA